MSNKFQKERIQEFEKDFNLKKTKKTVPKSKLLAISLITSIGMGFSPFFNTQTKKVLTKKNSSGVQYL